MGQIDSAAGCCFSCCGSEAQHGVGGGVCVQNQSCGFQMAVSPWERIAFSYLALNRAGFFEKEKRGSRPAGLLPPAVEKDQPAAWG